MNCFKSLNLHKRYLYGIVGILSVVLFGCDDTPGYVFVDNNLPSSSFASISPTVTSDAYQEASIDFNSGNSTSITLSLIYGDSETRLDMFSIQ